MSARSGSPAAGRTLGAWGALRRAGAAARPRRLRGRRPRLRLLLVLGLAVALVAAGWFWVRDSSLVAVRDVEVTGISGPQAAAVRGALEDAARSMTTLHVRQEALDTAVAPFSIVKRIEVATDFPRTMRIHVVTNVAVGAVDVDGTRIAVTSDGTLLRGVRAPAKLPTIPLRSAPGGPRLTEPAALVAVAALGAAPEALRSRVAEIATTSEHGLTIQLAHGPQLRFGDRTRLVAKWAAASAVLADAEAAGASFVDVMAPERPAVGGLADGAPATGESDVPALPDDYVDPDGAAVDSAAAADATADPAGGTADGTGETVP